MTNLEQKHLKEQKKKTVLIVEDDPINARIFYKILSKRGGLNVKHTEDVEEVMQIARSGAADIILMDVSLAHSVYQGKGVGGIEITQMLKADAQTSNLPIILVTAHAMEGDALNFMKQSGANYYISKPVVDHQQFLDTIRMFFDKSNHELELYRMTQIFTFEKYALGSEISQLNKLIEEFENKNDNSHNLTIINNKSHQYAQQKEYKTICGSVAHSLKGEFMNIGSSMQEIRELAIESSDIQEECDLICRSLEYSQILLRQLLDYLDVGKPSIESIGILELIRKTELLARPRLPSNIDLEVTIDSILQNQKVLGNLEQLMSVLLEFIKNATKSLRQQGGKIELYITKKDSEMAISVKDNGTGIPEEIKDKLFKETVHSKSGLGLGLFFSNKVINELGGQLDLQTSHNEGTKVTILLPIAK